MKVQVPTCPACNKEVTLVLGPNMEILCEKPSGGCGARYSVDRIPELYKTKEQDGLSNSR